MIVAAQMQIFIKTLTGRKTNFNFEPDNTVRHVKEALQAGTYMREKK